MFDVLIVDDESLAREYVKSIIDWEYFGLNVCAMARDGEEAIELIKKYKPSIAIIDIVMPTVDGIALAQYLRDNDINIQIIVISGIESFSTVRKTIQLNVRDYLLKPFDVEDLENILLKLVSELKDNKNDKKGQKIQQLKLLMRRNDSSLLPKIFDKGESFITIGAVYILQDTIRAQFLKIIEESDSILVYREESSYFGFIIGAKDELILKKLNEIFRNFSSVLLIKESIRVNEIYSIDKEIESNINDVLLYESSLERLVRNPLNNDELKLGNLFNLEQMFFCIKTKNQIQAIAAINKFVDIIKEKKLSSNKVYKLLRSLIEYIATLTYVDIHNDDLWYTHMSFTEIRTYLIEALVRGFEDDIRDALPTTKKGLMVRDIKNYIHLNLSDSSLSIDSIAKHFEVASAYLRRTFKDVSGNTINNYIIESRCEKAKEYLRKGYYIHSEIAEKVGYNDAAYFSRSFKKVCGMSPKEYELFASNT